MISFSTNRGNEMTFSRVFSPIVRFQGAETFYKRLERDRLFTKEPLPDFDKIADKEVKDLFIQQKAHAKSSKKVLDQAVAKAPFTYRIWAERWKETKLPEENQRGILQNSLKDAGLTINPNDSLEDIRKLFKQYVAHEHDEKRQNDYGVGELSDKAVKILKEWKTNPTGTEQLKPTKRSLSQRITNFFTNMWKKIKNCLSFGKKS